MRDVRQGPDGLLYVLTDESNGKLMRLLPELSVTERKPGKGRIGRMCVPEPPPFGPVVAARRQ